MSDRTILVRDLTGLSVPRPVSGGVPLPEGATRGDAFALRDEQGQAVPVQTQVLARWHDGSARWVLLDFVAAPPPHGVARLRLSWDTPATSAPAVPLAVSALAHGWSLRGLKLSLRLVDAAGAVFTAATERTEVEVAGPVRTTILCRGDLVGPTGRAFSLRLRVSAYAGLPWLRIEPMVVVDADQGVLQLLRELALVIAPAAPVGTVHLGGQPDWSGPAAAGVRLFQGDADRYQLEGTDRSGDRAPGWLAWTAGDSSGALALRECWQQWPKSLEASPDAVVVGLFPRHEAGTFGHLAEDTKYGYLFDQDGGYRLRTGQARRWEVWLDPTGDGATLAAHANAPLVAAAEPAEAIATGVWDAIAPAGGADLAEYDAWAERLFSAYLGSIEAQRDYGAMNWGDWYGERHINWGNHEYDTANQLLIQFARTADPRYFLVAEAAARHSAEVDTVHHVNDDLIAHFGTVKGFPARPGLVHQHTVGHVSGFYPPERIRELLVAHGIEGNNPYLCLDPYNLGHIWTQGLARFHFLTGDPFARETVERVGGNLAQMVSDREYRFMGHNHCGRTTGWSLLALAGAYELELGERFGAAMRTLVDDALAEQDPHCGGWLYTMGRGHCECQVKHIGMAGFITAVLINGLSRYALLARDPELPAAIERAVTFLTNDTWREEWQDWRYTSCPATGPMSQMGVIVMAYVNSVRLTGNPEHRRVLEAAWSVKLHRLVREAKPGQSFGKQYSATMYGCAEAMGLLGQSAD